MHVSAVWSVTIPFAKLPWLLVSLQTKVLPASFIAKLPPRDDLKLAAKNQFSDRELKEYRKTSKRVALPPWNLTEASTYLKQLTDRNAACEWGVPPMITSIFESTEAIEQDDFIMSDIYQSFMHGTLREVTAKAESKAVSKAVSKAGNKACVKAGALSKAFTKGSGKACAKAGNTKAASPLPPPSVLAPPPPGPPAPPASAVQTEGKAAPPLPRPPAASGTAVAKERPPEWAVKRAADMRARADASSGEKKRRLLDALSSNNLAIKGCVRCRFSMNGCPNCPF